jgi:hypothetical protein
LRDGFARLYATKFGVWGKRSRVKCKRKKRRALILTGVILLHVRQRLDAIGGR